MCLATQQSNYELKMKILPRFNPVSSCTLCFCSFSGDAEKRDTNFCNITQIFSAVPILSMRHWNTLKLETNVDIINRLSYAAWFIAPVPTQYWKSSSSELTFLGLCSSLKRFSHFSASSLLKGQNSGRNRWPMVPIALNPHTSSVLST